MNLSDVYRWLFVEPAAVCLGHGQEHLKILEDICHDMLIPASHASQCELSKFRTPPAMQRDFPIMPSVRTFLALNVFNRFRLSGAGLTFRHDTDDFVNGTVVELTSLSSKDSHACSDDWLAVVLEPDAG